MIETRCGGDPDTADIVFTDLTPTRLEQELAAKGLVDEAEPPAAPASAPAEGTAN